MQKNKECNKASDLTLVGVLVSRMLVGCLVVPYLLPLASGGSDANQMDKETLTRRGTEVWHHLRALLLALPSLPTMYEKPKDIFEIQMNLSITFTTRSKWTKLHS